MKRTIVQAARTIGPGYGVSGPTWHLEKAFIEAGCRCERFSLEDLGLSTQAMPEGSPLVALLRFWRDVVLFSTAGSLVLWWRYRHRPRETAVLCQVDALYGDIYVVRSVHKGFLERRPDRHWMLLRNPLHSLVLLRDYVRFKGSIHRHFVALSETNKQELIRLYQVPKEKITVIPNGVDRQRFRPRPEAKEKLNLKGKVAIFAGHEFERKGLRLVLEALRQTGGWTLLVAGRDDPSALKREFADLGERVRFVGNRSDLELYYAASDLFVMPAAHDISPLVGPEALASGVPLLMTRIGGVLSYLHEDHNGFFIEADPSDIAARLSQLRDQPELLARLKAAARPSVSHLDWSLIAQRYLELLDRVMPSSH